MRLQIKFPATEATLLKTFDENATLQDVVDYAKEVGSIVGPETMFCFHYNYGKILPFLLKRSSKPSIQPGTTEGELHALEHIPPQAVQSRGPSPLSQGPGTPGQCQPSGHERQGLHSSYLEPIK